MIITPLVLSVRMTPEIRALAMHWIQKYFDEYGQKDTEDLDWSIVAPAFDKPYLSAKFAGDMYERCRVVISPVLCSQYLTQLGPINLKIASKFRDIHIGPPDNIPYLSEQFFIHARRHRIYYFKWLHDCVRSYTTVETI